MIRHISLADGKFVKLHGRGLPERIRKMVPQPRDKPVEARAITAPNFKTGRGCPWIPTDRETYRQGDQIFIDLFRTRVYEASWMIDEERERGSGAWFG